MKYWRRIYIGGLADCSEIRQYKIRQHSLQATRSSRATPLSAPEHARGDAAMLRYFNPPGVTALPSVVPSLSEA